MGTLVFSQIVHPADIPVGDLAGQLELVPEAGDRLLIAGDIRSDDLDGDLFLDLYVEGFIDLAHAAMAELFNDLVAAGEQCSR
jgi:hypothetical protein